MMLEKKIETLWLYGIHARNGSVNVLFFINYRLALCVFHAAHHTYLNFACQRKTEEWRFNVFVVNHTPLIAGNSVWIYCTIFCVRVENLSLQNKLRRRPTKPHERFAIVIGDPGVLSMYSGCFLPGRSVSVTVAI